MGGSGSEEEEATRKRTRREISRTENDDGSFLLFPPLVSGISIFFTIPLVLMREFCMSDL